MSIDQPHVSIETLLTHRDRVRWLARSLVRDTATADDLEQRTWLVALRRPPRSVTAARAWLARVVRNLARNAHRESGRRAAHERAGGRPGAERPAAEIVAEAEAHRRLVDAVLELDEPYRSTVLMRFFEDLPPRDVARRAGVPVETVRTRVRRALAKLRTELSAGEGRGAWLASLAPIAGIGLEAGAVSGASGTAGAAAAAITGGTIMAAKATVIAAVGVGLVAGYLGGRFSGSGNEPTPDGEVADLRRHAALESTALESADTPPGEAERRLAEAVERQAEQDRRIEALEAELAAARKRAADPTSAARGLGPEEIDAKLRRLRALPTKRLLSEVERLTRYAEKTRARADVEGALLACEVAIGRSLETGQRAYTLLWRGRAHLVLADHANAEESYREALRLAGPSSRTGRHAADGLAYAAKRRNDPRTAADWYLGIVSLPDTPAKDRAWYRFSAAVCLAQAGDTARARDEFRATIDEFGDDKSLARIVRLCRKELEKLDLAERGR